MNFWCGLRMDIKNKSVYFFFSSRRRHTRLQGDWSSDVCSSDIRSPGGILVEGRVRDGRVRAGQSRDGRRTRGAREEIGRASCRERV